MRQSRILLTKSSFQRVERFLGRPLARDDPKRPIANILPASKPFVRPRKKDGSGETTFHHAVNVPTEHFRLLFLRMADRVHAEFAKDERAFFS